RHALALGLQPLVALALCPQIARDRIELSAAGVRGVLEFGRLVTQAIALGLRLGGVRFPPATVVDRFGEGLLEHRDPLDARAALGVRFPVRGAQRTELLMLRIERRAQHASFLERVVAARDRVAELARHAIELARELRAHPIDLFAAEADRRRELA